MSIVEVAAAVIERADGAILLGRRAADTALYPGYWEFPGGKVEAGESPLAALRRELREELGVTVIAPTPWLVREHVYDHAHVRLNFFRVQRWRGQICDRVHDALAWTLPDAAPPQPLLPANAPLLAALALPPFYGVSHAWSCGAAQQLNALTAALGAGLRLVQLRENDLPEAQRESFTAAAVAHCQGHGARVLLNSDTALARAVGADGVHLPASQLMSLNSRPNLPLVAASCHDREELERAARLGLDFVVLGPVQATASHEGQHGMGWREFARLVAGLPLPVFAIGGMRRQDIPRARSAGAHGVAAIRAAWGESSDD